MVLVLIKPLAFTATATAAALAASDIHRLTLNDLVSVEPIGETKFSPDGKIFAFVREGQIVTMPANSGWPTSLTSSPVGRTD